MNISKIRSLLKKTVLIIFEDLQDSYDESDDSESETQYSKLISETFDLLSFISFDDSTLMTVFNTVNEQCCHVENAYSELENLVISENLVLAQLLYVMIYELELLDESERQ